jgi:hypothetical protein
VLAVRHEQYLKLDPDLGVEEAGGPLAILSCFAVLDDDRIRRYLELDCEVKDKGRGPIKRIKDAR